MKRWGGALLFVGALWCLDRFLPAIMNSYDLLILLTIGINLVMATSLNLINGYTGQFNLGHAGFMAIGAYASAAFSLFAAPMLTPDAGGWTAWFSKELLFLTALLAGGLAAAISGLNIGLPTLRLRGDYLAIATLGFGEIVQVLIVNTKAVGGATGLTGIPEYSNFFWIFLFAGLTLWVVGRMTRSAKGLSFLAIREDEIAALSIGISNTRVKVTAFVLGAFFAGLGGGLFAHLSTYLHVNTFSFLKSIDYVVMVVLGGMGNLWGVALATVVLTVLPEKLRAFQEWRMILYSLLIIFTMLLRSRGIAFKKWFRRPTTP